MTDTLRIAEMFGPTIQGEGPTAGRPTMFLRLMACNLACTWCDTPYTWNASQYALAEEGASLPVADILTGLTAHPHVRKVVITGGEPLLHQTRPGWTALLDGLAEHGMDIEIETNGTITPSEHTAAVARFNVSPKLTNSGIARTDRIKNDALAALRHADSVFKFVVADVEDLTEIDALVCPRAPIGQVDRSRIWVMPQGTTAEETLSGARALATEVLARGWNLALRQHVLIWPDEPRGR